MVLLTDAIPSVDVSSRPPIADVSYQQIDHQVAQTPPTLLGKPELALREPGSLFAALVR